MYDPGQDGTAGGAIAKAIVQIISAHKAVTQDGTPIIVLHNAQGHLAYMLNEYIINRIEPR